MLLFSFRYLKDFFLFNILSLYVPYWFFLTNRLFLIVNQNFSVIDVRELLISMRKLMLDRT